MEADHCEVFDLQDSNASVYIDFYTAARKRLMKVQVESVMDGGILSEAKDFADLVSPVFHVGFDGGDGGKVPDGGFVDLIVEISSTHAAQSRTLVLVKFMALQ